MKEGWSLSKILGGWPNQRDHPFYAGHDDRGGVAL